MDFAMAKTRAGKKDARRMEGVMRKKDELSKKQSCMSNAHPSEMTFVLLGRDVAAPFAIRSWVNERLRLGKNEPNDPQILEALRCAETMESEGRQWVGAATHYPPGMGEESRGCSTNGGSDEAL